MPQRPRDPERRPEGAEAADAFARDMAEQVADLGDLVSWDDEDLDRDLSRDDEDADMPPSGPGLRGGGGRGAAGFNAFPSTTAAPLRPVMTVLLPIRPWAGRPIEALARRNRYYALALRATHRWLRGHREVPATGRIELHILTDAWPLCPLPPVAGVAGSELLPDLDRVDPFDLRHVWRRTGRLPFAGHAAPDAHAAFSSVTRRHRGVLDLEVRVKLCDRRRVLELPPFNGGAWPPGW